ncbi:hypothetical protein AB0B44_41070, partial [Streptomyces sp. NPDC041003]
VATKEAYVVPAIGEKRFTVAPAAGCGSACGGCSGHGHEEAAPVPAQAAAGEVRPELVAVRRRGAGTDIAPNA